VSPKRLQDGKSVKRAGFAKSAGHPMDRQQSIDAICAILARRDAFRRSVDDANGGGVDVGESLAQAEDLVTASASVSVRLSVLPS